MEQLRLENVQLQLEFEDFAQELVNNSCAQTDTGDVCMVDRILFIHSYLSNDWSLTSCHTGHSLCPGY